MKTTKDQLKKIVKECLVEILAEDFIEKLVESKLSNMQIIRENKTISNKRINEDELARTFLNKVQHGGPSASSTEVVKRLTSSGGKALNNPVMNAILADTAQTTLPQMLSEGARLSGGGLARGEDSAAVDDIPDGDSHWADVAFAEHKNRP